MEHLPIIAPQELISLVAKDGTVLWCRQLLTATASVTSVIGWPGRVHDAGVLTNSRYSNKQFRALYFHPVRLLTLKVHTYQYWYWETLHIPSFHGLMKPFPNSLLKREHSHFNYCLTVLAWLLKMHFVGQRGDRFLNGWMWQQRMYLCYSVLYPS